MRVSRINRTKKAGKIQHKHQKTDVKSVKSAEGFFLAFYFLDSYTLLTKRFAFF